MKTTPERRQQEFLETERRALEYLRDATAIPSATLLDGYCLRFRLWHYPAFEVYRSWSVFASRRDQVLVRQVTWDRLHDCQRLRDPLLGLQEGFHTYPKIELRDRRLESAAFAARFAEAQRLSLPIVGRDRGVCLDGAMLGYEEHDGSPRVQWCCDGPAEWREFTTWAGEMMRWLLDTCAAERLEVQRGDH